MDSEYFPFNKGAMGTYGPYTLLRSILVVAVYYLVAENPITFGQEVPEELLTQWPIIAAITVPFLYLIIFKGIGGLVIRGVDIAAPIQGQLIKIRTEVTRYGMDAAITRLYRRALREKSQSPLTFVETCFCSKTSNILKSNVASCITELAKSQKGTDALCVKRNITGMSRDLLVISGWLSRIDMIAKNVGREEAIHHSVLKMCT